MWFLTCGPWSRQNWRRPKMASVLPELIVLMTLLCTGLARGNDLRDPQEQQFLIWPNMPVIRATDFAEYRMDREIFAKLHDGSADPATMMDALKAVDDLQAHHDRRAMADLGRSLNLQLIAELDRLVRNANIVTPKLRFDFAEIKPSDLQRPAALDAKALDALKAKVRQLTLISYLTYTRLDGSTIQLTSTLVRLSNGQSQSFMVTAPVTTVADVLARVWFDYFYGNRFPQHSNPMLDKEWLTAAPGHLGKLVSREAAERYCASQKATLPDLPQMELGEAAGFHHGGISLVADSLYHIQNGMYYSSETSHVDGRLRKNLMPSTSNGYYYCIRHKPVPEPPPTPSPKRKR